LGDAYTESLRAAYKGRVPGGADLVCYWFEKARSQIEAGTLQRAGLVATNSIRGGRNREVLDAIAKTTRIFEAWSDEPWVNDGAAVRVSLIGFGRASEARLDGSSVVRAHPTLHELADRREQRGYLLIPRAGSSPLLDLNRREVVRGELARAAVGAARVLRSAPHLCGELGCRPRGRARLVPLFEQGQRFGVGQREVVHEHRRRDERVSVAALALNRGPVYLEGLTCALEVFARCRWKREPRGSGNEGKRGSRETRGCRRRAPQELDRPLG
jgi:hypothetical protein